MLRALCLTMTVLFFSWSRATADTPPQTAGNAALKYWQAFATLPPLEKADEERLRADSLTMPLDANARELVAKADYSLKMLHRAAALRRCDWGLSFEDGIEALLPHAQAARVLSNLAYLRARMRFEEDRVGEAVNDIVAAMTLGRYTSRDGSLITVLVGYNIEQRGGQVLARYLPKLGPEAIKELRPRLAALPRFGTPATALLTCELETVDWLVRQVEQAKDKESLVALLGRLAEPRSGQALLAECGGTAESVAKLAEQLRPSYTRIATKLDLPLDEFEGEFDRMREQEAGNPLFNLFFPALDHVRLAQARSEIYRAMLAAALAVELDGPEALEQHPDPVVGGAFEYVAFEGGLELRSHWELDERRLAKRKLDKNYNKPLVLVVGQRRK
jgi:hypothetical protein